MWIIQVLSWIHTRDVLGSESEWTVDVDISEINSSPLVQFQMKYFRARRKLENALDVCLQPRHDFKHVYLQYTAQLQFSENMFRKYSVNAKFLNKTNKAIIELKQTRETRL